MTKEKICPSGHVVGPSEERCVRCGSAPVINDNETKMEENNNAEAAEAQAEVAAPEVAPEAPVEAPVAEEAAPAEAAPAAEGEQAPAAE